MSRTIRILAVSVLALSLTGCPSNPASMSKTEVEALLKTKLELKEISLEAKPGGGGFTGTGKGTDGTPFNITVDQDKAQSKLSYKAQSTSDDEMKEGSIQNK